MRFRGTPIEDISLCHTPALYCQLARLLAHDSLATAARLAYTHAPILLACLALAALLLWLPLLQAVRQILQFAGYWVTLGVASSIGLGTGLHTFVLYLAPHVARVALTATVCGKVPQMLPSRWDFDHFAECSNTDKQQVGVLGILLAVQLEGVLWGIGTALGELPPYFVAKKAAEARLELQQMQQAAQKQQRDEEGLAEDQGLRAEEGLDYEVEAESRLHADMPLDEVAELVELRRAEDPGWIGRIKLFVYRNMERYGFWTILAFASVPNPLFDLAGITSGHFRIPFRTFFGACLLGKAVIKVHLQLLTVIALFRRETLALLASLLRTFSASLADGLLQSLQARKKALHQPSESAGGHSLVSLAWDCLIASMVVFCVKSILDAHIKEKALALRDH